MPRLTAADSWFLYLENPSVHLHVTGVVLLDPSTSPDGLDLAKLRRHMEARIHMLPAFRRRLIAVPFGIDHPTWIDDPDLDLDDHLHHHVLEPAGSPRAFAEFVGHYCAEQLDRSRPLWDMVYVEGLEGGRTALVTKLHHTLVDGITGVGIMADLLDTEPDAPAEKPLPVGLRPADLPEGRRPDLVPSPGEAALDATVNRLSDPMRPVRALWRTGCSVLSMAATTVDARRRGGEQAAAPMNAPRTPFNVSVTPRRAVAFGTTALADVKATRRAFGVTVNDVVLAACTSGLRRLLLREGALPDGPLTCSVPVSVHGRGGTDGNGGGSANQVSNMFVHLPVHLDDPVEQLMAVHRSSDGAKAVQDALSPELIGDVVDLIPPPVFSFAAGMYSRAGLADRLPPVHNLIVSNVPGSPIPLYMAGAQLVGLYPFGPLMEGTGLNVTVLSNMGHMDVGIIACPDLIPDVDELLADILDGFATLLALARERDGEHEHSTPKRNTKPKAAPTGRKQQSRSRKAGS